MRREAYLQYKYGEGDQTKQLDVFNKGLIEFAGCMEAPINGMFLRLQEALSHLESVSEDGFLASKGESFFYSSNRKKDFLRNGEVLPCDCPVLYTDYFVRDAQGDPSERLLELYD